MACSQLRQRENVLITSNLWNVAPFLLNLPFLYDILFGKKQTGVTRNTKLGITLT